MIVYRPLLALAAPLLIASGAAGAAKPEPFAGTLTLDMADPVVTVTIASVPLRLRVGLAEHDVIELNAAAFDRLALPVEPGSTDAVGRIDLPSRVAGATFEMNGRPLAVTLSTHGTCCDGVDGTIGAALLPYAEVRFIRSGAARAQPRSFVLSRSPDYGLQAEQRIGGRTVTVRFALDRAESLATASAGAILAANAGGRFDGAYETVPVAFGISRPSRIIAFARPVTLAGFRFDRLRTRTADFAGRETLPREPREGEEIVVLRRTSHQNAWPAITIGRDRLDRCTEIGFRPETLALTLRCDFGE